MSSRTPESRSNLLAQLRADQAQRWRRGERVPVEHYLTQHPELSADPAALVELVQSEILRRREAGEQPALEDYLTRFPNRADLLRREWPALSAPPTKAWEDSHGSGTTVAESRSLPPAPPPPSPAGLRLPGLELHEKVGEGGMGFVYRARDVRLDQPRAIKVIRRGAFGTEEARERFNREAKAVARLDHPGVVRIFQLGEHEDTLFICMDFVEGGSLQTRLRNGPLEARAAAELVCQLALAVQHAHDHHVLHRDLKPGNVLLTAAGEPKVSDFGLAKLLDTDDDLTVAGAVLGTPSYMAPEQAEGRSSEVRECTDVWALGTILYECLTGKQAFKGETRSETLEQVRHHAPVPPREVRPEVPVELESVCLKCLEKDPARRCASAAELAAGLRDWLDARTVVLLRAPRTRRVSRRRLAIGLAAALVVGVAAGLFFLPKNDRVPVPPPEPPTTAKPPPGPGEWQDLLAREPAPLRWPDWMKKELRYEATARTLHVSASDRGLVKLGETKAARWRLAVKFQQTPWVGNVGLFFGYRAEAGDGEPGDRYQVIELVSNGQAPAVPFRLAWTVETHRGAPPREQFVGRGVAASEEFRLAPGEHTLELAAGPDGLESAALDGKVVLRTARPAKPPAADCRGVFGVYVHNGNGTLSESQFLYYEEPQ
jgi:serine/threonine protein kinase